MKKILLPLMLVSLVTLTGCATSPPKPQTFDQLGQFSSYPLNAHSYRVSFKADSRISYGRAEEIALLKAAQTTLQNGFLFFKVLDDPSNQAQKPPRQAVVYSNNNFYPPYGYYRRYPGFWPDPFFDSPQVVNIDPIEVSYSIECFKEQASASRDAFDARLILASLGSKYGLSPTGQVLTPVNP